MHEHRSTPAFAPPVEDRYEVGYRDGENSAHADWWIALTDHSGFDLPQDVDASDPFQVANWIARLSKRVAELERRVHGG